MKITAVIRYRDAARSARWLSEAFGFRIESINENSAGSVDYICLRYGKSMLLVCPEIGNENRANAGRRDQLEGQSCYLTVSDIESHFARAAAHGADVALNPEKPGPDTQFYLCRDPEGHLWSFGTHDFTAATEASNPSETEDDGSPPETEPTPSAARDELPTVAPVVRRGTSLGLLACTALLASGLTAGAFLLPIVHQDTVATIMVGRVAESSASVGTGDSAALHLLRSEIAGLQRERESLASAMKRSEDERNAAAAARAESERSLSQALRELEGTRSAGASDRTAAAAAESELAAMKDELTDATAGLDREHKRRREVDTALKSAMADRDAARAEVRMLTETVATLQQARDQAVHHATAAADQASALRGLQTNLDRLTKELDQRGSDLEQAQATQAQTEASLETVKTERAKVEAALKDASAAGDAAEANAQNLATTLADLRQSHQAALESIKIKEEERVAALAKLDTTSVESAAARAEAAALQPTIDTLRARIAALETVDQGDESKATLAKAEARHKADLASKDKLISSLTQQLKASRLPAKPKKAKARARPKVATAGSTPAKPSATAADATAAQPVADEIVLEDFSTEQPSSAKRCSRHNYDDC